MQTQMTAFDLIDSIFSRVQQGVPGHQRRISAEQLSFLERLINEDPEGSAYRPDGPGKMIWMPAGRTKYIVTREPRMLTKMSSVNATAMDRLF